MFHFRTSIWEIMLKSSKMKNRQSHFKGSGWPSGLDHYFLLSSGPRGPQFESYTVAQNPHQWTQYLQKHRLNVMLSVSHRNIHLCEKARKSGNRTDLSYGGCKTKKGLSTLVLCKICSSLSTYIWMEKKLMLCLFVLI